MNQIPHGYNQGFTGLPPSRTVEYEPPDALDLSEADFGPSAPVSTGDGGYFIPEDTNNANTNGYYTHRKEQTVHPGLISTEPVLNSSEYLSETGQLFLGQNQDHMIQV